MFAALRMAIRRMASRPVLTASFLLGLLLATGVASSIPLYTDGGLRRLLHQELAGSGPVDDQPAQPGYVPHPPGIYWITVHRSGGQPPASEKGFNAVGKELDVVLQPALGVPVQKVVWMGSTSEALMGVMKDPAAQTGRVNAFISFRSDFEEQVELTPATGGPKPNPWPSNWAEEVPGWVNGTGLNQMGLTPGDLLLYDLDPDRPGARVLPIRIAGVFTPKEPADPYWYDPNYTLAFPGPGTYRAIAFSTTVMVPEEVFWRAQQRLQDRMFVDYHWYYRFDPLELNPWRAGEIAASLGRLERRLRVKLSGTQELISPAPGLWAFAAKVRDLRLPLVMFSMPLLAQLTYFMWLAARLAVNRSAAEIAMLRSRGASPGQIVAGFLTEALLLAAAAAAAGPALGVVLARAIGASAGFLHFVVRQSLPVHLTLAAWAYAASAALLGVVAFLPPAVQAARTNILSHRRQSSRTEQPRLMQGVLLGLSLLAVTSYAYLRLRQLQAVVRSSEALVDPVLLLAPALGIYAIGVLTVYFLPLLAGVILRVLAPLRGAVPYLPFLHLARKPHLHAPLILLVTLTVGLGVNSSLTAHTLDKLTVDRARHQVGTDLRLTVEWPADPITDRKVAPPDSLYGGLPGVTGTARVVTGFAEVFSEGRSGIKGPLMAVEPAAFDRVAYLRPDLAPYYLRQYLWWLDRYPNGVLVPQRFMAERGLSVGNALQLQLELKVLGDPPTGEAAPDRIEFQVLGAIPHWPGIYETANLPFFIINKSYLEKLVGPVQEQVWMRLSPDADPAAVVQGLAAGGVGVTSAEFAPLQIYRERLTPERVGLNGILTLSFLAGVAITLLAFWLHSGTSLQARLPRFGVMRAMGLSRLQLAATLVWEVGLTTLAAVAAGAVAGGLTAQFFLPLLERAGPTAVPPLVVLGRREDLVRLYTFTAVILVAVLGWLLAAASRLRLYIAVKLGQEE